MTHQWFKDQIQKVDALAEVDFEAIRYGIRIRPSHPRYRDAICEMALDCKPMGVQCEVAKEVYEPITYPAPRKSWWSRMKSRLKGLVGA